MLNTHQVRIWDLPTRLCHWLLVVTFIVAMLSQGDDRYLDIHVLSGYVFLELLGFRLIWGFIGSHYARFSQFLFDKKAVWHYLKTLATIQRQHFLGHNPAGSWAIFFISIAGDCDVSSGYYNGKPYMLEERQGAFRCTQGP